VDALESTWNLTLTEDVEKREKNVLISLRDIHICLASNILPIYILVIRYHPTRNQLDIDQRARRQKNDLGTKLWNILWHFQPILLCYISWYTGEEEFLLLDESIVMSLCLLHSIDLLVPFRTLEKRSLRDSYNYIEDINKTYWVLIDFETLIRSYIMVSV
jgi:hypothetical protein